MPVLLEATRAYILQGVAALAVPDMERLRYVFDAVTSIRKALAGRRVTEV
jgi:hypothetical protein